MKKALLLLSLLLVMSPVLAQTTTTTTKEFVPFTEAIDRAKLQHEADMRAGKQSLEQKRTEIQNKVDAQKKSYEKQQQEYAQKKADFKKQNEAKKQQIKNSIDSSIQRININQDFEYKVSDTVYNTQDNAGTPKKIRDNNALDFTRLRNYVNGKTTDAE